MRDCHFSKTVEQAPEAALKGHELTSKSIRLVQSALMAIGFAVHMNM